MDALDPLPVEPERAPPPADLQQFCAGILRVLEPTELALPDQFLRFLAQELVPRWKESLQEVTGQMRRELERWQQGLANLEHLCNREGSQRLLRGTDELSSQASEELVALAFEPESAGQADAPERPASPLAPESRDDGEATDSAEEAPTKAPQAELVVESVPESPVAVPTCDEAASASEPAEPEAERSVPARVEELCRLALEHRRRNRLTVADAAYSEALRLDPKCVTAYLERGQIHRQLGKAEAARADFSAALRLAPQSAEAYLRRGNVYLDRNMSKQAIADYTRAIEIDPDLAAAWMNRALAHSRQRNWYEAIIDASAAADRSPKLGGALFVRAVAQHQIGGHDAALADLNQLVSLEPRNVLAFNERGLVHASMGLFHRAIADYAEALRLKPSFSLARYNRAVAFRLKGDTELALAEFTQIVELMPHHAVVYHQRGLTHMARSDFEKAVEDFKAALELDPACAEADFSRRKALQALDRLRREESPPARPDSATLPLLRDHLHLKCPACAAHGLVRWDRLGQVFQCRTCAAQFRVQCDGNLLEMGASFCWRDFLQLRQIRRRFSPAVAALFLLLFALGWIGWQLTQSADFSPLPSEMDERAELLTRAWVSHDHELVRQLTAPAQVADLKTWLERHPSPAHNDDMGPALFLRHARFEVRILNKADGFADLAVRISGFARSPVELKQHWVKKRHTWYFQPRPDGKQVADRNP